MVPENTFSRKDPIHSRLTCFLILIACILTYSNSFQASWHFDDEPVILGSDNVHLKEISLSALARTTSFLLNDSSSQDAMRFRPVAAISFALNWYAGADRVFGYHVVNVGVHILCTWVLFFLLLSFFRTPILSGCCEGDEQNIALLAAFLWAVHPIQTQAVTYIVQRMTLLSTLFYLSGLLCFIHGRIRAERRPRLLFFSGCFFFLLLAMGSKENAVMFPLSLVLVEFVFFNNLSVGTRLKTSFRIILAGTVSTGILSVLVAYSTMSHPFAYISSVSSARSFTLVERLMTEPRIVIGYLTQIFYPLLTRFSIEHSVAVSTSLLNPVTTLASIVLISGLLVFALFQIQKKPILSFSILFFFLNHIMESTVIPLELVFEHRNYLPSAFIFFPAALAIVQGLRYYQRKGRQTMFSICFVFTASFMIVLGATTYMRNAAWSSERTLWEDALSKAPQSARPYERLANYYNNAGLIDTALSLYETARTKQRASRISLADNYTNSGNIYSIRMDFEKALGLYDRAISINPTHPKTMYNKALTLADMGRWEETKNIMNLLISNEIPSWENYNLLGMALLKLNDPADALNYFRKALQISPGNVYLYMNIGACLNKLGHHFRANWFLRQSHQRSPDSIVYLLCLIDAELTSGNTVALLRDTSNLLKRFSINQIKAGLLRFSRESLLPPVSTKALESLVSENIKLLAEGLSR
jgi:tetratricopeptide (TPR) repeat protein